MEYPTLAEYSQITIALAVLYLSVMASRLSRRLTWLTGAMESHSNIMVRIEALRGVGGQPIKMIWWDPNLEKPPVEEKIHGREVNTDLIYQALPENLRAPKKRWFRRS